MKKITTSKPPKELLEHLRRLEDALDEVNIRIQRQLAEREVDKIEKGCYLNDVCIVGKELGYPKKDDKREGGCVAVTETGGGDPKSLQTSFKNVPKGEGGSGGGAEEGRRILELVRRRRKRQ